MILPFPLCTSQGDFRLDQTYFNTKIVFSIVHEFSARGRPEFRIYFEKKSSQEPTLQVKCVQLSPESCWYPATSPVMGLHEESFLLMSSSVLDMALRRNSPCYHAIVMQLTTANFSMWEVIWLLLSFLFWVDGGLAGGSGLLPDLVIVIYNTNN